MIGIFLFLSRKRSLDLRRLPADRVLLEEIYIFFNQIQSRFNSNSKFIRFSESLQIRNDLVNLITRLSLIKNIYLKKECKQTLINLRLFEEKLDEKRNLQNDKFVLNEKERASEIFYDQNGSCLLTDDQIAAVLCDDDRNLIIAGAGSGKTRVIDFKVRYLVNYKKVDPKKIILLSFSRKSASDLAKKISENVPGIEARTIHSFSMQLKNEKTQKIFDESKNELGLLLLKAISETLKDEKGFSYFNQFYNKYFTDIKPLIFYSTLDELRADLHKSNSKLIAVADNFSEIKAKRTFKTLNGETVRSVDERYIADFLFLHGIAYEYEKKYPYSEVSYYPDFYLSNYDIYLEHFAITSNGNPPPYFDDPQKYLAGIDWKRDNHQKNKTMMIESFSYLLNEGDSSVYLSELLISHGIAIDPDLVNEKALGKVSRVFNRFIYRFFNAYKTSGLSLENLKAKYTDLRFSIFISFFEQFLLNFKRLAQEANRIDFSDLIENAVQELDRLGHSDFEYIIVDEFQDTSNLAMRLVDKLAQSNPKASLFCVGDDWQSIYGFNGSDVTILSEFDKKYKGVSIRKLNESFRSHSKIVELGRQFISRNPAQIPKSVVSRCESYPYSEIDFLIFSEMEKCIQEIPENESIFILYRYNDDCPAQRGIFRDYFYLNKQGNPVRREGCKRNISPMTIHASKGLEAQHVFVLFPNGENKKFPSEVEDHFVFNMLQSKSDEFLFSEERRLMYVAITRAQQNLYFVAPGKSRDPNSVFWDELKSILV